MPLEVLVGVSEPCNLVAFVKSLPGPCRRWKKPKAYSGASRTDKSSKRRVAIPLCTLRSETTCVCVCVCVVFLSVLEWCAWLCISIDRIYTGTSGIVQLLSEAELPWHAEEAHRAQAAVTSLEELSMFVHPSHKKFLDRRSLQCAHGDVLLGQLAALVMSFTPASPSQEKSLEWPFS
eukprot:5038465-Amphidinium_carterae.1